jgi:hypothetical protein
MAHRPPALAVGAATDASRNTAADFDRVFTLAAEIAAAAAEAKLAAVRSEALALEKSAAAAHLGGPRSESELLAAGLKVIEQILAAAADRQRGDAAARAN